MDKQNIFRTSQFFMSDGDTLHVIVKDLDGVMPDIELCDEEDNVEDSYTP